MRPPQTRRPRSLDKGWGDAGRGAALADFMGGDAGLPVSLGAVPLAFRIPLKDNIGANDQGLSAARSGGGRRLCPGRS